MFKIIPPPDRAEIDMNAVALAFGLSITELEDGLDVGTISRWFEVGEGDEDDKPHQIFASATLGIRVDVDESGNVHSSGGLDAGSSELQPYPAERGKTGSGTSVMEETIAPHMDDNPEALRQARLDALLDEALLESFPASDPVAISFDTPKWTGRSGPQSDDGS